jgi:ribosome-associated translation inhibitor RaiA
LGCLVVYLSPFYNDELNSPNSMNIQFHVRGLNDNSDLRRRLLQPLASLQRLTAISAVAVVLEHRRDQPPPFRAFVLLAVPGPDIHAEARDHTLEAAWLKATTDLRKQIERRKNRQLTQPKSDRQLRGTLEITPKEHRCKRSRGASSHVTSNWNSVI